MSFYCTSCHCKMDSEGHIFNRRRVCDNCYEMLKSMTPTARKEKAAQDDKDKELLFSYFFILFPISEIPDSWHNSIDGMLKKGYTVLGVRNTLAYVKTETEKVLTQDNWAPLVYLYYSEAQKYLDSIREIAEQNANIELKKEVHYYTPKDTTKRDTPSFNMEDL